MAPDTNAADAARKTLDESLDRAAGAVEREAGQYDPSPGREEVGRISSVGRGVVWVSGLEHVTSEELVLLGGGSGDSRHTGMALDVRKDRLGVVLLSPGQDLLAGDEVSRTGKVLDVPVGDALLGRVVDPLGTPLDEAGPLATDSRLQVLRQAPPIIHRAPVDTPLQTGVKVVDAVLPIGRGQRELILGDRQTGKTAIAVDAILNQKNSDVVCIYCSIGQRGSSVAKARDQLKRGGAMDYTVMVVVEGEAPPGLQYIAPYAATSMAEQFMSDGKDVLIVYDDLTRHAVAYRELSLLLRRPPGREAYPGDIFYIHSSLLERSTHLRPEHGGGSLTALPIIETEAQNISAYIPTNLISITDGQIYVSPELFQKGILPAIEVGRSVSRVGGKAQLPSYSGLAGDLRLSYAQFEELESFARFGTRMDEDTRASLEHGKRVRAILKQDQASPLTPAEQVFVLVAVNKGLLDHVPEHEMPEAEKRLRENLPPGLAERITDPQLQKAYKKALWQDIQDQAREIIAGRWPYEHKGKDDGNKQGK